MPFEPFLKAFDIGFYVREVLIFHLPLVIIGFAIRAALRTSGVRFLWLGVLLASALGCSYLWDMIGGFEQIGLCFAAAGILDFSVGTALMAVPDTIYRIIASIVKAHRRRRRRRLQFSEEIQEA